MSVWAVIATGQSLKREDVDYLEGKCHAAAISNAYEFAPWANLLISHDAAWWKAHPDALNFKGHRYCRFDNAGTKKYSAVDMPQGCNSGLMGMFAARDSGATKILLLGFDMHGTHYFGPHTGKLSNTTDVRFGAHMRQFARFSGCEVINCTPDSALTLYPAMPLREAI